MRWYDDPEYQLMCEKAEEIQEIARKNPPAAGACLLRHLGQSSICVDEQGRFFLNGRESRIYLPSQEDLQEMVVQANLPPHRYSSTFHSQVDQFGNGFGLDDYYSNSNRVITGAAHYFKNWNQLWLAFVMHELYRKKWNPEKKEWEKTK